MPSERDPELETHFAPVSLATGRPAPEFELTGVDGHRHGLADYRGRRLVLFFYPKALTAGCTRQAVDFAGSLEVFRARDVAVVGVSRDSLEVLAEFRDAQALTFDLLSDPDHRVHAAYGAWGEKVSGSGVSLGVIRSTFLIGPDGAIEQAMYGVDPHSNVAEVLALLTD